MPVFTKNTLSEAVQNGEREIVVAGGKLTRKLQALPRIKQLSPEQIETLLTWAEGDGVHTIISASMSFESFGMANIFTSEQVAQVAEAAGIDIPLAVSFVVMCSGGGTDTIRRILQEYSKVTVKPQAGTRIELLIEK